MKIEFDKAILWLLPYLYLVSVMYYWGYWGTFNVDVFNYYDVGDIIKGVISPIRSVVYYSISIIFLYQANDYLHKPFEKAILSFKAWKALLSIVLLTLIGLGFSAAIWYSLLSPFLKSSPDINNWIRITVLDNLCFILATIIVSSFEKNEWTIKTWLLIIVVALPPRAFVSGKETALLIIENKQFNYIITDSLIESRNEFFKYLGKAGEYNILLNMNNSKQIIISSEKITPLVLEWYSIQDEKSVIRFRRNIKRIY